LRFLCMRYIKDPMVERKPEFSEYESTEMGRVAREIANMGEAGDDVVWDLVRARLQLMQFAILWHKSDDLKALFKDPESIHHEIDVVTGVIDQSRLLMQMAGTDQLSILDRRTQEAGMGSVFDPESEISKHFKEIGLDLFSD